MRRREFITLLGGTAAAWPLAARAQPADRLRRVGVLMPGAADDPTGQSRISAFLQRFRDLGWTEGRNVSIDVHKDAADQDGIATAAAELVGSKPDVILTSGSGSLLALLRETRSIPIVFAQVFDPVGAGFVKNLARPGGNVTGFTPAEFELGGKMLEILKELAPGVSQVAVMLNRNFAAHSGMLRVIEAAAPSVRVQVTPADVQSGADIEHTIAALVRRPNGGLIVLTGQNTHVHRNLIFALAAKHRLPAIYSYRYYVTQGGLLAYGVDVVDLYRHAASYVDRILKGEKPADLPVQQPTRFEFAINLKTAKALGLEVPPTLLARADEVLE
jgi:putative ABC transport system substrate-binding protein